MSSTGATCLGITIGLTLFGLGCFIGNNNLAAFFCLGNAALVTVMYGVFK